MQFQSPRSMLLQGPLGFWISLMVRYEVSKTVDHAVGGSEYNSKMGSGGGAGGPLNFWRRVSSGDTSAGGFVTMR